MRFAITGGTGFVGRHLARQLAAEGHEVVLLARGADCGDREVRQLPGIRFQPIDLCDEDAVAEALRGCDAVAHCAGINRELGKQTYRRVHVEATRTLVAAAKRAGVRKIVLLSFLRARPNCGSPYHESKWAAEEIVRESGLDYTVVKSGMVYGKGDHMLNHLSRALRTFPVFFTVGFREKPVRPIAVDDVVRILHAALVEGRLQRQTVAVLGPEEMYLTEAVRRVARVLGKRVPMIPLPIWIHRLLAIGFELVMQVPLASRAQVRMLQEGIAEAVSATDPLPVDLQPQIRFGDQQIRSGVPGKGRFGLKDLLFCAEGTHAVDRR